jgi:hypothetical protein
VVNLGFDLEGEQGETGGEQSVKDKEVAWKGEVRSRKEMSMEGRAWREVSCGGKSGGEEGMRFDWKDGEWNGIFDVVRYMPASLD